MHLDPYGDFDWIFHGGGKTGLDSSREECLHASVTSRASSWRSCVGYGSRLCQNPLGGGELAQVRGNAAPFLFSTRRKCDDEEEKRAFFRPSLRSSGSHFQESSLLA